MTPSTVAKLLLLPHISYCTPMIPTTPNIPSLSFAMFGHVPKPMALKTTPKCFSTFSLILFFISQHSHNVLTTILSCTLLTLMSVITDVTLLYTFIYVFMNVLCEQLVSLSSSSGLDFILLPFSLKLLLLNIPSLSLFNFYNPFHNT